MFETCSHELALSPHLLQSKELYEFVQFGFPSHRLKGAQDERGGFICTHSSHDVTQGLEQKGRPLSLSQVPWKPAHLCLCLSLCPSLVLCNVLMKAHRFC